jgi:hypothetical protein
MLWPKGGCLAYNSTDLPNLLVIFPILFHNTSYVTWIYPILQLQASFDVYAHIPSTLWVSIFYVVLMATNALEPMVQFVTLLLPLHEMLLVGWEQLQMFPLISFNYSCWRIEIVLTKDGIRILANVIIADPMWVELFFRSCATQGFAASDAIQVKERSHCNRHPINQFLPLAIEVFGCLHKHADVFSHDCANAIWSLKGQESLHLSTLVIFLLNFFWSHYKGCKHRPS